ncbi:MAG: hypothetical protein A2855_02025 [Candidatus Liptonbacteria bacterium RIFCSPHIGHO2_01_FULL_57_28]|uniref:Uncharacterized protein n=1 Tax=Candidatus Liptonbacteria bacterium RIFCSPHIGHO2_01_FULL_57_28 TaxID=1798647 RepID=A0A1G2CBL1_9BACT|nr:MAG: hypothetical protein A2855_02025 [Candidatus Liptonbacteria bacterium RIFCSPHIGHO2_01_FULL_57_28]
MQGILTQITALLGVTVGAALIAKFLRQPIIVAYIFAGIVAGPLFLNLVHGEREIFHIFSQLGVILLLFMIGLSLNFNYLRRIGKVAVAGGLAQVIFTGVIGMGILRAMGFAFMPALYLAVAITFSSTIIITKLLSDKKDTDSLYGRHTVGLMLVQDLVAVLLMVFLTAQGGSMTISSSLIRLALGGLVFIVGVTLLARYILPPILRRIADSKEFLFLFAIAWCFALAYAASRFGFSIEIGAVAAGLALGSSTYQPEISARITPLRDFFLIIFFVILGAEMSLAAASTVFLPSVILSLFILIGNPLILYVVYRLMKFSRRNSLMIGLTAAQVSEFGFVLLFIGRELGYVGESEIASFTMVALATIFVSSYLITHNGKIAGAVQNFLAKFSEENHPQREEKPPVYDAWVIGYHRIGWNIVQVLKEKKRSFAVIDFDPTVIEHLTKEGVPAYFLDVSDVGLLSELPLDRARLVISTIPDIQDQVTLLKHVRLHSAHTVIVANAPEAKFMRTLYEAGADYVMTPHLLGGKWIGHMISDGKASRAAFRKLKKEQQEEIRSGMPVQEL